MLAATSGSIGVTGNGNWVRVGKRQSPTVAASPDGSVTVINSNNGSLWRKTGDNATANWTQFGGGIGPPP